MGDNERQCVSEPCLGLKRFPSPVKNEPGTARSAGRAQPTEQKRDSSYHKSVPTLKLD